MEKTSAKMSTQSENCEGVDMSLAPRERSDTHVMSMPIRNDSAPSELGRTGPPGVTVTVLDGLPVGQPASATRPA